MIRKDIYDPLCACYSITSQLLKQRRLYRMCHLRDIVTEKDGAAACKGQLNGVSVLNVNGHA